MSMRETIEHKLNDAFSPSRLEIIDESHLHQGHMGWREGGETHFRVVIRAAALGPISRVERHRQINAVLADELATTVHALAINAAGDDAD